MKRSKEVQEIYDKFKDITISNLGHRINLGLLFSSKKAEYVLEKVVFDNTMTKKKEFYFSLCRLVSGSINQTFKFIFEEPTVVFSTSYNSNSGSFDFLSKEDLKNWVLELPVIYRKCIEVGHTSKYETVGEPLTREEIEELIS